MLEEIAELGFGYVELSHGVRISLIPGVLRALDEGMIKVSSVHNFCPLPVGINHAAPNLFEPSAPGERERAMWLRQTLRTIEFAESIGCDRMVIHSGSVRFLLRNPAAALEALEDDKEATQEQRQKARDKLLKRMRKRQPKYKERLVESLGMIAEACGKAGLKGGLENREGYTELPLDEEAQELQQLVSEHGVFGYWHDAGHAQLKDSAGLLQHAAFLEQMRPHLIGFHLHDVSEEGKDHQPPGSGIIDWDMIASHIQQEDTVVLELSPRLKTEQIRDSRAFLLDKVPLLRTAAEG
jgi:sugar phosphate isomerase/epimerase